MFRKHFCWSVALSVLNLSFSYGSPINSYGITLRDTKEKFSIFMDGSAASDIVQAEDGSVSWVSTAASGGGGGVAFYIKSNHEEINIANYESFDIELDYSPVEGKWTKEAKHPGFCVRLLPWDSSGMFGGFEDLECFDSDALSGSLTHHIEIPDDFAQRIITSSDYDSVLGFAVKFNDYLRDNNDGDQLQVTLKNVKFNAKKNAVDDKPFDDGLTDSQRGSVIEINYPSRDYTVKDSDLTDADRYKKHAWVYLPAGYDANDKNTTYPVFILLHGRGQNENTWGLSNKGRGGKIKGYMDRGMASGKVEKFILLTVTGIASKNWGPNGAGMDMEASAVFDRELRNDLIPFIRANFNVKEGRDNVALAGLSMGGNQTFNNGIAKCLDLISHFAGFSGAMYLGAPINQADIFVKEVDANPKFDGLKIHNLYMICGDADNLIYDTYPTYVEVMKHWNRVEYFMDYTFPGGTHDFPVWYKGFKDFIQIVFKNNQPQDAPVDEPNDSSDEEDVEGTHDEGTTVEDSNDNSDNEN